MTANTAALTPLSGLDALFLQLESQEMPMHVGSLSLLELPAGYRGDFLLDLRALIGARLHLAEAFRRKLVPMPLGLANPAWMRADAIDLDHHIRRITLPRPGTQAQLEACVGRLHAARLDRTRPLWELVIIDGLGGRLSGHVGYYAKVHHAAIDGQAGVALAQAMLDLTPQPRDVPPAPNEAPVAMPGVAQRLRAAAAQSTRQLRTLASLLPVAADAIGTLLRSGSPTAPDAPRAGAASAPAGVSRPVPATGKPRTSAPWLGPRTPLNVSIGAARAFSSASLPLADVKQVARALDASLNDIVLATCSGALRRWLAAHGGVPRKPIAAGVPFSVRNRADAAASNKVSMMRAGLATHLADPAARLAQIQASMRVGKAVTGSLRALVPTDYPSLGSAWVVGGLAWLAGAVGHRLPVGTHLPSLAAVAVSNVPGPPMTLYVAGARVVHYWPASIVVHGVALNITVQSYADWLDIGLTACRQAVPDLRTFKRHLVQSFAELQALAQARGMTDAAQSVVARRTPAPKRAVPAVGQSRPARSKVAATAAPVARGTSVRPRTTAKATARAAQRTVRPNAAAVRSDARPRKRAGTATPIPDTARRSPARRR
jgi:diacylglycerol O-acyltransferase / wax synthase